MPTSEQLEHRKKWVEALRSGEFEQGYGWLNKQGNFCCLGVACEINQDVVPKLNSDLYQETYAYAGPSYVNSLPPDMQQFLGIDGYGSVITEWNPDFQLSLARLNDAHDFTFEEIADVIENNMIIPLKYKHKVDPEVKA